MATKFPNLIDWMDDVGMAELHDQHMTYMKDAQDNIPFSNFVAAQHNVAEGMWEDEMFQTNPLKIEENENDDMDLLIAKDIFVTIFNNGIESADPGIIVTQEECAPDAETAKYVINTFWNKVVPAVKKALEELK